MSAIEPFYPIVDSADWVGRLVGVGAKFIQLRVKDVGTADARREIDRAMELCRKTGAKLVVNDYWELAIEAGAGWLHLGQTDLDTADLAAIRARNIRLGISTHSLDELERALTFQPDYVALGPIFPTILKAMPFAPQGIARIGDWKRRIGSVPLVAIGGLNIERARQCLAAGADSVAVVTDITLNADPEARAAEWLEMTRQQA
jgi:thiamine-phosphate pyrophosphorylase